MLLGTHPACQGERSILAALLMGDLDLSYFWLENTRNTSFATRSAPTRADNRTTTGPGPNLAGISCLALRVIERH